MKEFDQCGVCDGNGKSCLGCDGMPFSGIELDRCGECGADGTGCSPTGLVIVQQPGGVVAGSNNWLSMPQVAVAGMMRGNSSAQGERTLLVRGLFVQAELFDENNQLAAYQGTSMVTTDRSGVAKFDDIKIPEGGKGYRLKFAATLTALMQGDVSGVVTATSEPFAVTIVTKVEPKYAETSGGQQIFVRVEYLFGVTGLTDLGLYFMTNDQRFMENGTLVRVVPWDDVIMEVHALTPVFPQAGAVTGVLYTREMGPYRGIPFDFEFRWPYVRLEPPFGPLDGSINTTMMLDQGMPVIEDPLDIIINFGSLTTRLITILQSSKGRLQLEVTPPVSEEPEHITGTIALRMYPEFVPREFKYQYYERPYVLSLVPNSGPLTGGTLVEIVLKKFMRLRNEKQTDGTDLINAVFGERQATVMQVLEVDANTIFVQVMTPPAPRPAEVLVNVSTTQVEPGLERDILSAQEIFTYKVLPAKVVVFSPIQGTRYGGDVIYVVLTDLFLASNATRYVEGAEDDKAVIVFDQREIGTTVKYWDMQAANISFPTPFINKVGMVRVTVMNSNYIQTATTFLWAAMDPDVSADCVANCVGEASGERTTSVLVQNLATVGEAGAGLLVGIDDVDYRGRMVKVALAPGVAASVLTTIIVDLKPPPVTPISDEVYGASLHQSEAGAHRVKFTRGTAKVYLWLSLDEEEIIDISAGDDVQVQVKAGFQYTYRISPRMVRARLNSIGTEITVSFDQTTNKADMPAGAGTCSNVFHQNTVNRLGQNVPVACIWHNAELLTVILGTDATILPGLTLQVRPDTIMAEDGFAGYSTSTLPMSAPIRPAPPWAALEAPSEISQCEHLDLYYSGFESPRPMEYEWHCPTEIKLDVALAQQNKAHAHLPLEVLELIDRFDFIITVRARNFLGRYSNTAEHRVKRLARPALHVVIIGDQRIQRRMPATFTVRSAYPECFESRGPVQYQWYLDSQISPAGIEYEIEPRHFLSGETTLQIPALTLNVGGVYTIGCRATVLGNFEDKAVAFHKLYVDPTQLDARIQGGNRYVSVLEPFELDAAMSFDPDAPGEDNSDLSFEWTCRDQYDLPCRSVVDSYLVELNQLPYVSVGQGLLAGDATYTFCVTVKKLSTYERLPDGSYVMRESIACVKITIANVLLTLVTIDLDNLLRIDTELPTAWRGDTAYLVNRDERLWLYAHIQARPFDNAMAPIKFNWYMSGPHDLPLQTPAISPLGPQLQYECGARNPYAAFLSGQRRGFCTALVIAQGAMLIGAWYTVLVTAVQEDLRPDVDPSTIPMQGQSSISIHVNPPPTGGVCRVSPKQGIPMLTEFEVTCGQWADEHNPLSYEFGIRPNRAGAGVFLGSTFSNHDVLYLPSGMHDVVVRVSDNYGASAEVVYMMVEVQESLTKPSMIQLKLKELSDLKLPRELHQFVYASAAQLNYEALEPDISQARRSAPQALPQPDPWPRYPTVVATPTAAPTMADMLFSNATDSNGVNQLVSKIIKKNGVNQLVSPAEPMPISDSVAPQPEMVQSSDLPSWPPTMSTTTHTPKAHEGDAVEIVEGQTGTGGADRRRQGMLRVELRIETRHNMMVRLSESLQYMMITPGAVSTIFKIMPLVMAIPTEFQLDSMDIAFSMYNQLVATFYNRRINSEQLNIFINLYHAWQQVPSTHMKGRTYDTNLTAWWEDDWQLFSSIERDMRVLSLAAMQGYVPGEFVARSSYGDIDCMFDKYPGGMEWPRVKVVETGTVGGAVFTLNKPLVSALLPPEDDMVIRTFFVKPLYEYSGGLVPSYRFVSHIHALHVSLVTSGLNVPLMDLGYINMTVKIPIRAELYMSQTEQALYDKDRWQIVCLRWANASSGWTTEHCRLVNFTRTQALCACSILATVGLNFTALPPPPIDYTKIVILPGKRAVPETQGSFESIPLIAGVCSLFILALTAGYAYYYRRHQKMKNRIKYLASLDADGNPIGVNEMPAEGKPIGASDGKEAPGGPRDAWTSEGSGGGSKAAGSMKSGSKELRTEPSLHDGEASLPGEVPDSKKAKREARKAKKSAKGGNSYVSESDVHLSDVK
jgi:hypothetical protein